jgi:cysteine desulfurase / selenocysteine lyase
MIAPTITQSLESLRKDFPILSQDVRPGVPLIYLDSAATSQKPLTVLEAEDHFYREINANVHRGVHAFSERATAAYEGARVKVKHFINARSAREIVFTRNTTESINLVAYAWGLSSLQSGDEIILTEMEHHANMVSWQIIAQRQGAVIRYIPVTDDGQLDLSVYDQLLTSGKVKLVSVAHVSNVLGTVNPVVEIIQKAHAVGALTMLDAAQSAPHLPIDVQALDIDFLAFSGHKMLGPTGIGVLYGKREVLENLPPFMGGGSMINDVSLEGTTFADIPQRFEAGTPPIAQAIALGAAIDYLDEIGLNIIHAHELALTEYAISLLKDVSGLTIFGPQIDRIGVISFTLKGLHPHDIAQGLDSAGIAIRAGHHCAQPLHKHFHLPATARASFYLYNTVGEVEKFVQSLEKLRALLARRG